MRNLIFLFCFWVLITTILGVERDITTLDAGKAESLVWNYASENLSWGKSSTCAVRINDGKTIFSSEKMMPISKYFPFFYRRDIEIPVQTGEYMSLKYVKFSFIRHAPNKRIQILKCACKITQRTNASGSGSSQSSENVGDIPKDQICKNGFVLLSRGVKKYSQNSYFVYVDGTDGNVRVIAHLVL